MRAPRLARLLIRLVAPADRRDDLLGDLEESHDRRRAGGALWRWVGTCLEGTAIAAALLWSRLPEIAGAGSGWVVDRSTLRLGIRFMLRQPVLTATAVVSLALGIGLATVGFAFMETAMFSRLPFQGGDRFVVINVFAEPQHAPTRLTPASYRLLARDPSFEYVGGLTSSRDNVTLPSGEIQVLTTAGITPTALRYLPWGPLAGRLLLRQDAAAGATPVAMIRDGLRRRVFPNGQAVGASIQVAGIRRTIVGVVPDDFEFPNAPEVWLPLGEAFLDGHGLPDADLRLFGILSPGEVLAAARGRLEALAPALGTEPASTTPVRLEVTTFTDLGPMGSALSALVVGLVLAVLVVIAANVGNLILARSFARAREFSLRAALGASRRRLVTQVFVEVLLLAGAACIAGTGAAVMVLRRFNAMDELPYWADFTPGPRTVLLVIGVTLAAAVVAGVWPALRATRSDLVARLQAGGSRGSDVRFGRAAGAMVILQIAVSIVMLNGAAIFGQAFAEYSVPSPDVPRDILTTSLSVNATRRSADGANIRLTADDVEQIASAVPGVIAAGLTTAVPRFGPPAGPVEVDGDPRFAAPPQPASPVAVTRGYFATLDVRPLAGRLLAAADYLPGAAPVAVVDESFAREFFGGAAPIGRRLRPADRSQPGSWREIVGVVPDLGVSAVDPTAAAYYVPVGPDASFVYLAIRTTGDPLRYETPLRRALVERDAGLVPNRMQRLEDVGSDDVTAFKWLSAALIGIGAITLLLALVGIYAMMALIVTRRTREIGIRVALGASTSRIVRTILRRTAWQVSLGGTLGVTIALLSLSARGLFVSRLGTGGPWTLPAVVAVLIAAALAATWIPLRRALTIRPTDALRAE